jgi:pimeloyl-ACP methyl ester carboxylesterase
MEPTLTPADVEYIEANFVALDGLCAYSGQHPDRVRALIAAGMLPAASYVLEDGTEMVPADYFELLDEAGGEGALRGLFARRYLAAGGPDAEVGAEWESYLTGAYGVCLKRVTPENIARKSVLVAEIDRLLESPEPEDAAWRERLRSSVDELDGLERPFAPHYDRARWGPSSRDRCITAPRERYPEALAPSATRA